MKSIWYERCYLVIFFCTRKSKVKKKKRLHSLNKCVCKVIDTVVIGEEDTMVNKMVVVNEIVHLGPPPCHCRGPLYKMVP